MGVVLCASASCVSIGAIQLQQLADMLSYAMQHAKSLEIDGAINVAAVVFTSLLRTELSSLSLLEGAY